MYIDRIVCDKNLSREKYLQIKLKSKNCYNLEIL